MQTKLTRYADGLMEAVWLSAVVIVPVFFNIYSSRIFEPDKIALLRSLVLLGLAAWIVKSVALGGFDRGRLREESAAAHLRGLIKTPLVPAVLGLCLVYLAATVFSVTPRVSLLGSYQRLQGAYTTLSYVVLFAIVAVHMRERAQIERLVTTAILTSLPIGLYGIMQRYEIDPIPWGGDTSFRVAGNLGNSIFIAAYLIMAFPLALGRIIDSFSNILDESQRNLAPQIARGTVYVFTAAIQLIAIYFSLSRGPILGLLAGTFFMFVLLSLYWGKRWLTFTTLGAAAALGVFLVVFSIRGGPFESLRSNENIGRIGNVFETESGTGRVRVLIWRGAAELVGVHAPLEYPDGSLDRWNFLRPLIGYGPESMYVAFNAVYPPELADIEARNASPDRSHNETWDALVITGILGLAAEQVLFISVFYYGLKWLGLLDDRRQRWLFLGLILGGGLISSIVFTNGIDIGFLGVGVPFGMLLGLLAYLALTAVFFRYRRPETEGERARALVLMMFLGAVIAHYVEIHFGIAISATRLYFWIFAGALLAAGYRMTLSGRYGPEARDRLRSDLDPNLLAEPEEAPATQAAVGRKARRSRDEAGWIRQAWIGGLSAGLLLSVLTFDYLTNPGRLDSIGGIIRRSLTVLPTPEGDVASYGILALFLTTWLAWAVIAASEWARTEPADWRPVFLATGGISLLIWLVFATLHAGRLVAVIQAATAAAQPGNLDSVLGQAAVLESLLTQFALVVLALLLLIGQRLAAGREEFRRLPEAGGVNLAIAAAAGVLALALSWQLNLRIIHADMDFKIGDSFSRSNSAENWEIALSLYQRAIRHAPQEDHYYLFLGKAYLELTRQLTNENLDAVRSLLLQAEADLMRAQRINPLNTDHTANLARLYRFWAGVEEVVSEPVVLLEQASAYYGRAIVLSPNNAVIWNEWGLLHLNELDDPERGLELLMHSLEVDPFFDGTYAILGDYYAARARAATETDALETAAAQAIDYYARALEETKDPASRYLYAGAMGGVYELIDDLPAAIVAYLVALENVDEGQRWLVEDTLAKLYAREGEFIEALEYAALALEHAPAEQKAAQQALIETIQEMQTAP